MSQKRSVTVPRLAQINVDSLCHIFTYLDLSSISRLGLTCHALHRMVEEYGWRAVALQRGTNTKRRDIISTTGSTPTYKHLLQVDQAWESKTFRSYQSPLPSIITNVSGKADRHQPQSILLLTPLGLLLFTGCEMRLWKKSQLRKVDPVQLRQSQVFHLVNPAGLDDRNKSRRGDNSALWDICACTQLDTLGHYVAIGRLNGLVEVIHIAKEKAMPRRGSKMAINLVWVCNPASHNGSSSSVQAMHACPSSNLMAIAYKDGSIRLYKLQWQSGKFKIVLLSYWMIDMKPWSIWVHEATWLAIGVNDVDPIIVYPLQKTSRLPMSPFRLSTGYMTKTTSVYALQTQVKECHTFLLAGCYDGTLRQYDIDSAIREQASKDSIKVSMRFQPIREVRDRFDPSAIYCLCDGLGENAMQVAAGTARYGVCKFFQLDETSLQDKHHNKSWSMFAAYPSQSPTYSIVGQFDRLFGVTDAIFWQIDMRDASMFAIPHQKNSWALDKSEHGRQTLAFYHHKDMVLDRTRWPNR